MDSDANDLMDEIEYAFSMILDDNHENNDDSSSVSVVSVSTATCEVSWMDMMTEDDLTDLEYTIMDMIHDYIESEIENMYMSSFEETMFKDIAELVAKQLGDAGIQLEPDDDELEEFILNIYHEVSVSSGIVPRSRPTQVPALPDNHIKTHIDSVLELLQNNEGQKYKQRTYEWYEYRAGLITASNIWKIFSGSQSVQNSLIYEKCKPFAPVKGGNAEECEESEILPEVRQINTQTAFHWGNKYEPLSIKLYERKYNTTVAEFGCIRHTKYPFIGASPDGINVLRESPRYGRMIEVKNIYNREITGIPKDEYWIQMQFQMETCGLTECDFIETRFKEYDSEKDFYDNEFMHDTRGIILYFVERNSIGSNPYYVYMPLDHSLEKSEVDAWIVKTREEVRSTHHLYEVLYWYLDEFSCVLVDINKLWLDAVIPKVKTFWEVICREKVSGYDHRSAKKREPTTGRLCLIKLDENGNTI